MEENQIERRRDTLGPSLDVIMKLIDTMNTRLNHASDQQVNLIASIKILESQLEAMSTVLGKGEQHITIRVHDLEHAIKSTEEEETKKKASKTSIIVASITGGATIIALLVKYFFKIPG